jgi:hypothetical protein
MVTQVMSFTRTGTQLGLLGTDDAARHFSSQNDEGKFNAA